MQGYTRCNIGVVSICYSLRIMGFLEFLRKTNVYLYSRIGTVWQSEEKRGKYIFVEGDKLWIVEIAYMQTSQMSFYRPIPFFRYIIISISYFGKFWFISKILSIKMEFNFVKFQFQIQLKVDLSCELCAS